MVFPRFIDHASLTRGAALVSAGQTGGERAPWRLAALAQAALVSRDLRTAGGLIVDALDMIGRAGVRRWEGEVHRVRGGVADSDRLDHRRRGIRDHARGRQGTGRETPRAPRRDLASPTFGRSAVGETKRATSSPQSTTGSTRASTPIPRTPPLNEFGRSRPDLAKSGGPASVPDTTAASRKPAVRTAYVRIPSVSAASLSAADATVRGQKWRELTRTGHRVRTHQRLAPPLVLRHCKIMCMPLPSRPGGDP
jgi:hypothetical protein